MRSPIRILLNGLAAAVVGSVVWSGGAEAQMQRGDVRVGLFGGVGTGLGDPVPWGIGAGVGLGSHIALRVELKQWENGDVCNTILPDFYRCSVTGRAALAGLRATAPIRFSPFLEIETGYHSRSGLDDENDRQGTVPVELTVGGSIFLGDRLFFELSAGRVWISDDELEALFDDDLDHRFVQFGLGVEL